MARPCKFTITQAILRVLDKNDGITTEELESRVSEVGDHSRAAFFRALKDLKANGKVVGLRESGRTKNHLRNNPGSILINAPFQQEYRIMPTYPDQGTKSLIDDNAKALIQGIMDEQGSESEKSKILLDKALLLYSLVETYEESKGIRYRRPWENDAKLEDMPLERWFKFYSFVLENVVE